MVVERIGVEDVDREFLVRHKRAQCMTSILLAAADNEQKGILKKTVSLNLLMKTL